MIMFYRAFRQLGNGLGNCVYDDKYIKLVKKGHNSAAKYKPVVPPRSELYRIVMDEKKLHDEAAAPPPKLLQRPVDFAVPVSLHDRVELPRGLPLPAQQRGTIPKMSFQHTGWKTIVEELTFSEVQSACNCWFENVSLCKSQMLISGIVLCLYRQTSKKLTVGVASPTSI